MPAYRDRLPPLLASLCSGAASEEDLSAAIHGLVARHAHVRAAASAALPLTPRLGEGLPPPGAQQLVEMYVARHDPHDPNVEPANTLWQSAGCQLPGDYAPHIISLLTSSSSSTGPASSSSDEEGGGGLTVAASAALASAMRELPDTSDATLALLISAYSPSLSAFSPYEESFNSSSGGGRSGRIGVATALKACAPELPDTGVTVALDFLVRSGLADPDDKVRLIGIYI